MARPPAVRLPLPAFRQSVLRHRHGLCQRMPRTWRTSGVLSQGFRHGSSCSQASLDTHRTFWRRRLGVVTATSVSTAAVGLVAYHCRSSKIDCEESASEPFEQRPLAHVSWSTLVRGYVVYACCSSSTLVDWSPVLTEWCRATKLPGVRWAFKMCMRLTFFPQFVGGETAEACKGLIHQASQRSVGTILAYSAEVEDHTTCSGSPSTQFDRSSDSYEAFLHFDKVNEILHSIEIAGQCNDAVRQTAKLAHRDGSVLIAVKLSGLLRDASVLERASTAILARTDTLDALAQSSDTDISSLSFGIEMPISVLHNSDIYAVKALWETLQDLARFARSSGNVRILIDAEYSCYQPAIDALSEACARQFNRLPPKARLWLRSPREQTSSEHSDLPLIYNTYQAYLRRTPAYLALSLERARAGNYSLGVKLVRGAYIEQEKSLWRNTVDPSTAKADEYATGSLQEAEVVEQESPVWPSKRLTDDCYDTCAQMLIHRIAKDVCRAQASVPSVAVVFAGHNWTSAMAVIAQMLELGLASDPNTSSGPPSRKGCAVPYRNLQLVHGVRGRVHLGQLYGMADDLTDTIRCAFDPSSGGDGPHVALKYVPYGDLNLVMPYLSRRAQENRSVLGDGRARREQAAIRAELWRRIRASIF